MQQKGEKHQSHHYQRGKRLPSLLTRIVIRLKKTVKVGVINNGSNFQCYPDYSCNDSIIKKDEFRKKDDCDGECSNNDGGKNVIYTSNKHNDKMRHDVEGNSFDEDKTQYHHYSCRQSRYKGNISENSNSLCCCHQRCHCSNAKQTTLLSSPRRYITGSSVLPCCSIS